MPPQQNLSLSKSNLKRKNDTGQACVIQTPFGVYDTESIDDMLCLHKANAIKRAVAEELTSFNSAIPKPATGSEHP